MSVHSSTAASSQNFHFAPSGNYTRKNLFDLVKGSLHFSSPEISLEYDPMGDRYKIMNPTEANIRKIQKTAAVYNELSTKLEINITDGVSSEDRFFYPRLTSADRYLEVTEKQSSSHFTSGEFDMDEEITFD